MTGDDDVRKILCEVEMAQQQTLGAVTNEPEQIATLKDAVLFLLDLLCQVDAESTQHEVLVVLRRVFLPCLAYFYDHRAFFETGVQHSTNAATDDTNSPPPSNATAESHRRSGKNGNVVLKAFLEALHALSSKSEIRMAILQGVVELVKEICVQSMSSVDVVMLFEFLRVGKSPARDLILEMQTALMEMETVPRAIFTMKGPHAGIVAPSSHMLFSKKGYTFSCGVYLSASSDTTVSLYSFRGNNGQGISAVLDGNKLVVKTHVPQGNFNQVVIPFADWRRQMEAAWTHFCVVHAKKMVFKDKLSVYMNGKLVQTANLVYPDPLCMVGGHNCIGIMPTVPGLQGKVWSPTLFGNALNDAEIEKLHWLTHWKNDLSSVAAENTGLTDKSRFSFSYDARSCDPENRICYDVSGNECHGWIEPGTNAFVTQGFAQALDTVGGCACFLLLLLDQIPEMADFHPKHEFSMDEISKLFGFVAAGLQNSIASRSHFIRLRGMKVVAFVLQSISPAYLSLNLLDAVTKILESVVDHVDQLTAIEYINLLLFRNTSWYLTPFDTQGKLLGDVLPRYLRVIQERKLSGKSVGNQNSSPGSQTPSSSSGVTDPALDLEAKREVDCCAGGLSPANMDEMQLEFLRKLVIHNLIDRLLFPMTADTSVNQWRQLVIHIEQRLFGKSSTNTEDGSKEESIEVKEIVRYLTQILRSDNQGVSSQVTSARQLMTAKVLRLSDGTLRIWWRSMMSANENVRLEALRLFEAYTLDKMVLKKRDMLMLYAALQPHALTLSTADTLLDIVIGKKHLGYFESSTSGFPASSEGGSRSVNLARQDFVPLILLGLIQNAEFDVQAYLLFEIKAQLSSPMSGGSLKEAIRSWPPWLGRLRAVSVRASQASADSEADVEATESELEPSLHEMCVILSDESSAVSSKLEAIQGIANAKDVRGCDFVLGIFQNTEQPASIVKAITTMAWQNFPQRCHVLVHKMANQVIVDIVIYSILYVRNGWLHFLEFYFYHFRKPSDFCNLGAAVCEKVLAKVWQKDSSSFADAGVLWENVCQLAAIVSQCQMIATQLDIKDTMFSLDQQLILLRKALELWLVVLPRMYQIDWKDLRDHLATHANYGSDVSDEEKEIFCHLVANSCRARFLALHTGIQLVTLSQQANETSSSLIGGFQKILELLRLVPKKYLAEPSVGEPISNTARSARSNSSSRQGIQESAGKLLPGSMLSDSTQFFCDKVQGSSVEREMIHLHILEACFAMLHSELGAANSFSTAFSIVEIMVAIANSALLLQSEAAKPELTKTLQIISSTDLSFFNETSQLQDFFTLWKLHREIHESCCDPVSFQQQVELLHGPFLRRWQYHLDHSATDFNPFLIQKHASVQAEILSKEAQCCEELWKKLAEDNAAAMLATEIDDEDEPRLTSLKQDVEKFASSVHKLICHTSTDTTSSAGDLEEPSSSDRKSSLERNGGTDGYLFKVDSKENGLRMHLRLKKVRENYRLRNLSYEYAGSSLQDSESRGSGRFGRRYFPGSREGAVYASDRDPSWRSDTGSDYSDFLADAQMRAAIVRSCSNADIRNSDYEVHSDEDDLDDEEIQYYDQQEDHNLDDDSSLVPGAFEDNERSLEIELTSDHSLKSIEDQSSEAVSAEAIVLPSPPTSQTSDNSPKTKPSSPLSAFSIGASVLSVVGGVAGIVQKAAKEAKDAVEFGVDSLYTVKDAIADEAQSLMDEVSTYMEENSADADQPPSPRVSTSPFLSKVAQGSSRRGSELFPPPSSNEAPPKSREKETIAAEKSRGLTKNSNSSSSKHNVRVNAKLIRHMHIVDGALILSDSMLHFVAERVIDEHDTVLVEKKKGVAVEKEWRFLFKRRRWKLDDLASLNRRRYLLKSTALEIFIHSTRRNYFFNFSQDDLVGFHEALMSHRPLLLKRDPAMRRLRHPSSLFRNSSMSTRWVNHEISTFEYLMWLNTIAGRTYNDLTQYPVFPWIIADYESPVLDLSRSGTFRDLSKPVGALDPTRLKFFLDRYKAFEDSDIPKFMYGTHYSNIGAVLYYLIRLEPYTSYALTVQGGKFDHADRLFHSVAETWRNCLSDFTDVKELTPEWFYLPDFLVNCNGLDLGVKQNGVDVGNVILPPWAKSPEDFVVKNLVALESEYVSANLHHWIDLVFGSKQRGAAAVAANNVFFYLTYEGMVDIDSIVDPVTKSSMRAQIAHFGQTPSQVLRDPHPQRNTLVKPQLPSTNVIESSSSTQRQTDVVNSPGADPGHVAPESQVRLVALPHDQPIVFVHMVPKASMLLCMDSSGMLSAHRYGGKVAKVHHSPFLNGSATKASGVFKTAVSTSSSSGTSSSGPTPSSSNPAESTIEYIELQDRKCRRIMGENRMIQPGQRLTNMMTFINGGTVFCTVGHHDFSARFFSTSDGTLLYRLLQHNSIVTCLSASPLGGMLALGSADGTLSVWKVANINSTLLDSIKIFRGSKSNSKPVHANDYTADQVLLGHSATINCVAISEELEVCISGSASNECLAHDLGDGSVLRQYEVPGKLAPGIISLVLSPVGHLVLQSLGTGVPTLYTYHFNGAFMAKVCLGEQPMVSMNVCARYSKVIVSNANQAIVFSAHTLEDKEVVLDKTAHGEIVAQALSPDELHLVFGVAGGKVVSIPLRPPCLWSTPADTTATS
ncbi:Kinase a-anchor protein, partial [Globisporangium splendens]